MWEAGWARSEGHDVRSLAPMAKLFACQTFRDVTATAQQIFGGVGFTLEYDIQLYFRRAKQLQLSWWNDRYLEELIAHQVLDTRSPATTEHPAVDPRLTTRCTDPFSARCTDGCGGGATRAWCGPTMRRVRGAP